jgi:hypothetical protein
MRFLPPSWSRTRANQAEHCLPNDKRQQTNNSKANPLPTADRKVVSPFTPCHRIEPVIGVDFAHACRDAHF